MANYSHGILLPCLTIIGKTRGTLFPFTLFLCKYYLFPHTHKKKKKKDEKKYAVEDNFIDSISMCIYYDRLFLPIL